MPAACRCVVQLEPRVALLSQARARPGSRFIVLTIMKHELSELLRHSDAHATLVVRDVRWQLYIFGVTRVGPEMLVQIAAIGPSVCTVTVRARPPIGNRETARQVLAVVAHWMADRGDEDQAFLELDDVHKIAS